MVLTLAIPIRAAYGLQDFITMKHLNVMAKVMLATGLIVAYGYTIEAFMAWYSGNQYERFMLLNRMTGPYWWSYWGLILTQRPDPAVAVVRAVPDERLRALGACRSSSTSACGSSGS